jgi:hypothetical protein
MTPNGPVGYVGSINFSFQSAHQVDSPTTAGSKVKPNRELGILFNDTAAINAVEQAFNTDFGNAALLPATAPPAESKERKAPN